MKSRLAWLSLAVLVTASAQQWRLALPGYRYEFPRDHFEHTDYQTEWWYYTGNVHAPDGHRFGFELTFFRVSIHLPQRAADQSDATWRPDQIYLAHLALSDLDGGKFYHAERLHRAGPGLAGASREEQRYWNGNWQVQWKSLSTEEQQLDAVTDQFRLTLSLKPAKPAVIEGQNGVSQEGPEQAEASHYLSFTRLLASGSLTGQHTATQLAGLAWMDHEFFSEARNSSLAGWDWFSIQLENNEELMLYRLRRKDGQPDAFSSGEYVDQKGVAHFLKSTDFSLQPGGEWQSPHSKARYSLEWKIGVPCLNLQLAEQTLLKDQELFSRSAVTPTYWEGAVTYQGQIHSKPVRGVGYLEMTGYDKAIWLRER